jgi:hypothetical protein
MTTSGNGSHVTVVGKFKDAASEADGGGSSSEPAASTSSSSSPSSPRAAAAAGGTTAGSCSPGVVGRDFKLILTTDVTNADFQLGYCMTGTLERGDRKSGNMELTHYAMVKRKGY